MYRIKKNRRSCICLAATKIFRENTAVPKTAVKGLTKYSQIVDAAAKTLGVAKYSRRL